MLPGRHPGVTAKRTSHTQADLSRPHGVDHIANRVDYHLRLIDVDVVRAVRDHYVPSTRKESSKIVLGVHLRRPERIGKRLRYLRTVAVPKR